MIRKRQEPRLFQKVGALNTELGQYQIGTIAQVKEILLSRIMAASFHYCPCRIQYIPPVVEVL
jgi:hypothetical protein